MHGRMLVVLLMAVAAVAPARADRLRVDGSLGFANIQQQAKPAIGMPRGERLVHHSGATLALSGAYALHRHLAIGAFVDLDRGVRRAGELVGFDADGRATIDPAVGGAFTEVWAGLYARAQWRMVFFDLGYPLFARRWDSGRDDLPAASGATDGAFAPILTVRWVAAFGLKAPLSSQLDLVVRLQWRIRYYDERGGEPLMDDVVHGTQEWRPLIGVAWRPGG